MTAPLKSTAYALYFPGRIQSLNGGRASWIEGAASLRTYVIWIKVSILLSAPVMRCALSCTACINFLFVWVQSVPHPASVTSSTPSATVARGDLRRSCWKCILLAVHWVTRSMVAQGLGGVGCQECPLSLLRYLKLPGFMATSPNLHE